MSIVDLLVIRLSSNNAFCGAYCDATAESCDGWFVDPYDGTFPATVIVATTAVYDDASGGTCCDSIVGGCNRRALGCVEGWLLT